LVDLAIPPQRLGGKAESGRQCSGQSTLYCVAISFPLLVFYLVYLLVRVLDMAETVALIVTFAGVALTSIKTVYEAVDSVREGSVKAQRTADHLDRLRETLEQLYDQSDFDEHVRTKLKRRVEACQEDMRIYASEIRNMKALTGEKRGPRVKKAISRILVGEKKLDEISRCVQGHTTGLLLQVDAIQAQSSQAQQYVLARLDGFINFSRSTIRSGRCSSD
jgi:hypothetical protein